MEKKHHFNIECLLLLFLRGECLIMGSRGGKEEEMNCAGKPLAGNLSSNLVSTGAFSWSTWTRDVHTQLVPVGALVVRGFLAEPWKGKWESGRNIFLLRKRQLSFFDRTLPGQVSAESKRSQRHAAWGAAQWRSVSPVAVSLTCGECGGGDAAPRSVLGCLQEHSVVCALGQALQSDPRVLCIHNQLLQEEPEEGGAGSDRLSTERGGEGESRSRAS